MDLNRLRSWLVVYAKGFAMGCADAVPGVSGGTIALITGIYERLIAALTSVKPDKFFSIVTSSDISEAREGFREMDGYFLTALGVGILTAVVSVLRLVYFMVSSFPVPTYGFFFGLILVSGIIMYKEVDISTFNSKIAALTGFLIAFAVSGYASTALGHSLPVVFVSGMLAVSAMVLPGISGSLILLILGQYGYMSGALTAFTDSLASMFYTKSLTSLEASLPIVSFILGGIIGLFTVAHSVKWCMEKNRNATFVFLASLVIGALRAPLIEVGKAVSDQGVTWMQIVPEFVVAAFIGGTVVFLLDYYSGSIQEQF